MLSFKTITTCFVKTVQLSPGFTFASPHSVRHVVANRHFNPKWKKFRTLKVIPIDIPDLRKEQKDFTEMTPEEIRSHYKEMGMQPIRPWNERPMVITCLGKVVDPYVPPEGDGKLSPLNSAGAKQKLEWLTGKGKSYKDLRVIRSYDEEFDLYPDFVDKAQDIYIKAHTALAEKNFDNLVGLATEKAIPEMMFGVKHKTLRWRFVKLLEPLKVSHVRVTNIATKDNKFGQITIRFHSQQALAIYDRFGRLMYGSETVTKDVLEYVVFEKQLSNTYGEWRLHAKIIPDWLPEKEPSVRTYVEVINEEEEEEQETVIQKDAKSDTSSSEVVIPKKVIV